eukprot:1015480-Pleurochrysis_carterae.AAC.2
MAVVETAVVKAVATKLVKTRVIGLPIAGAVGLLVFETNHPGIFDVLLLMMAQMLVNCVAFQLGLQCAATKSLHTAGSSYCLCQAVLTCAAPTSRLVGAP